MLTSEDKQKSKSKFYQYTYFLFRKPSRTAFQNSSADCLWAATGKGWTQQHLAAEAESLLSVSSPGQPSIFELSSFLLCIGWWVSLHSQDQSWSKAKGHLLNPVFHSRVQRSTPEAVPSADTRAHALFTSLGSFVGSRSPREACASVLVPKCLICRHS